MLKDDLELLKKILNKKTINSYNTLIDIENQFKNKKYINETDKQKLFSLYDAINEIEHLFKEKQVIVLMNYVDLKIKKIYYKYYFDYSEIKDIENCLSIAFKSNKITKSCLKKLEQQLLYFEKNMRQAFHENAFSQIFLYFNAINELDEKTYNICNNNFSNDYINIENNKSLIQNINKVKTLINEFHYN